MCFCTDNIPYTNFENSDIESYDALETDSYEEDDFETLLNEYNSLQSRYYNVQTENEDLYIKIEFQKLCSRTIIIYLLSILLYISIYGIKIYGLTTT